jgi:DNA-binding NtrC family response regulator
MEGKINIFILADNVLVVNGLRHYLEDRFKERVSVSGFYETKSCLKNINGQTHLVVLDYFIGGRSGKETLRLIKAVNDETEVIMHSSNEDVAAAVNAFMHGEKGLFNMTRKFKYKLDRQFS